MIDTPFFAFALYSAKFFSGCSIAGPGLFCKRFLQIFLRIFLPFIPPDSVPNLHQHFHRNSADGTAKMVQDGRGGKLRNTGEVLAFQILRRVQAAAGQEGILDAGNHKATKTNL